MDFYSSPLFWEDFQGEGIHLLRFLAPNVREDSTVPPTGTVWLFGLSIDQSGQPPKARLEQHQGVFWD